MNAPILAPPNAYDDLDVERQRRMQIIADKVAQCVELTVACQYAGVPYRTAQQWKMERDDFRAMLADAAERRTQLLEKEAWRRALAGSDTLMIFMLKAARPAMYRENFNVSLSNPDGTPLELGDATRAARILALLEAAKSEAHTIDHAPAADDIQDGQWREVIEERADGSHLV